MRNASLGWVVVAVLLATQVGCKKLAKTGVRLMEEAATAAKESAGADGAGAGADGADAVDDDEALNGLVDCLNGLDHSISKSLDRYTSWLPDAKEGAAQPGPTGKETRVWGLYEVSDHDVTKCDKGLKLASAKPQFKDVSDKFKAAADAVVPAINEAYTYYDRQDYKDDKFAKGKELHVKLWPLAEAFMGASRDFRAAVVKANDDRMEAEVNEVEAKLGRNLVFQRLNVMKHAKASVRVAGDEDVALSEIEPQLVAYEKAVEELKTYAAAHKDEAGQVMMWSGFEDQVEAYLKALKERARRLRDKKPYAKHELQRLESASGWMVEGSSAKVSREYNALVGRSNSLRL